MKINTLERIEAALAEMEARENTVSPCDCSCHISMTLCMECCEGAGDVQSLKEHLRATIAALRVALDVMENKPSHGQVYCGECGSSHWEAHVDKYAVIEALAKALSSSQVPDDSTTSQLQELPGQLKGEGEK